MFYKKANKTIEEDLACFDHSNHRKENLDEGRFVKPKKLGYNIEYPEGAYSEIMIRSNKVYIEDPKGYARDNYLLVAGHGFMSRAMRGTTPEDEGYSGQLYIEGTSELLCPDGIRRIYECSVEYFRDKRYPGGAG